MLKNKNYNILDTIPFVGVVLFWMLLSFFSSLYSLPNTSSEAVEFNTSSDLNFTNADDSKGFLFISEKDELEFREKDTILTLAVFSYTALFSVLDFKQHSFFTTVKQFVVQHLLLYDVFCAWKIPSLHLYKV